MFAVKVQEPANKGFLGRSRTIALEIEEWRLSLGYLGSMDESPSIDEQATAGSAATSKIRGKKKIWNVHNATDLKKQKIQGLF